MGGQNTNPTPNQTPPPVSQSDPRAELEAIKAQIHEKKAAKEASRPKIESQFYADEANILPADIAELKYSDDPADKKRYQDALNQAKAEHEQKSLAPHDLEIAALEDAYGAKAAEIDKAEAAQAINDGKAAFCQANPDCDFAALVEFWNMDTTQRQRDAVAQATPQGDVKGFYTAAYQLMQSSTAEQKEDATEPQPPAQQSLPPSFDGSTIPAGNPTGVTNDDFKSQVMGGR